MNLGRVLGMAATVVFCLVAVGCNHDACRLTIDDLKRDNAALDAKNRDLQAQLAAAKQPQSDAAKMNDLLAAKDKEIARLHADLDRARSLPPVPAGHSDNQPAADGWEKGINSDRVTLGSDIIFASGKADLTAEGKSKLDKIAKDLTTTYNNMTVRVFGYTDNDPISKSKNLWTDNLDLSSNRANAVVRYLWSKGVGKDRIEAIGMGDTHFVAANASADGKKKNRRVEIIVIKA